MVEAETKKNCGIAAGADSPSWVQQLPLTCRGELRCHENLAPHTSWNVGGAAHYFYRPADLADLLVFIRQVPRTEPILWLGLGSNTLIRDQGVKGVVIATQGCLVKIEPVDELTLRVEAGLSCAQAARFSARLGLTGIEFMAGIPGTIGGALAMNAGCFGGETWQHVAAVETLSREGELLKRDAKEFSVSYRQVARAPEEGFMAGYFRLERGDKATSLAKIRTLLDRRAATQPTGDPSGGSVFRNPPGDYAGRLIEATGLKGQRIGGAYVSPKHANFILNDGHASANDIEMLILHVAKEVEREQGIRLTPEVHILGDVEGG